MCLLNVKYTMKLCSNISWLKEVILKISTENIRVKKIYHRKLTQIMKKEI